MASDLWNLVIKIFLVFACFAQQHVAGSGRDMLDSGFKHRTSKAAERANELWCYRCHTLDSNDTECRNLSSNSSSLHQKCEVPEKPGEREAKAQLKCMVKEITFAEKSENKTKPKPWSFERNCSLKCEPGCIIIGERLKLLKCTSCCEEGNFCNDALSGSPQNFPTMSMLIPTLFHLMARQILPLHFLTFNS